MTTSRKLTEFCEFLNVLNETLDRFVYGISNEQIQKRLLSEENLTYDKPMESDITDSNELQLHSKSLASVNKVCNASCGGGKGHGAANSLKGRQCGYHGHTPDMCTFKDATVVCIILSVG